MPFPLQTAENYHVHHRIAGAFKRVASLVPTNALYGNAFFSFIWSHAVFAPVGIGHCICRRHPLGELKLERRDP